MGAEFAPLTAAHPTSLPYHHRHKGSSISRLTCAADTGHRIQAVARDNGVSASARNRRRRARHSSVRACISPPSRRREGAPMQTRKKTAAVRVCPSTARHAASLLTSRLLVTTSEAALLPISLHGEDAFKSRAAVITPTLDACFCLRAPRLTHVQQHHRGKRKTSHSIRTN